MILNTIVNENGTLNTIFPKSLWGKKVTITIQTESQSSWEMLTDIFQQADELDFQRKTHEEIIDELRIFRETQ